ncbi:MAG: ATP-binding protein, partial [Fusobacteria bacterium]|nr:ATP-binding protein [Fusobacteriota bacterium]
MFIGRKKELAELESRYMEKTPQLVVVYGKRRLGKTALLKEFAKDKTHFFYVSRETIDNEQIKLFS